MSQLINNLLEYNRVHRKRKKVENYDLNKALDRVVAILQISIQGSDAKITRGKLLSIDGDPIQLAQLFQNLLGNALRFHREEAPPEFDNNSPAT